MPKLLAFLPCENVLITQDQTVSLIQVMNKLMISGVPDPLPLNAATPIKWFLFAQWEIEPTDIGQSFDQRIRMVRGDFVGLEVIGNFTAEAGKNVHRMITNLSFFPLIPGGAYRFKLEIKRIGEGHGWEAQGEYPFEVEYQHIPVGA